jgi:prolyl-tRNA synthetase
MVTDCFAGTKRVNEDGMTVTKAADFARWYQEVVVKSEMIEYYDVSGVVVVVML